MTILQMLIYFSALLFLVANFTRFMRMALAPVHLRWELYPMPSGPGRSEPGYLRFGEEGRHQRGLQNSYLAEARFILAEVFLLRGVWRHNRRLWFWSYPFHLGLYLFAGLIALMILNGVAIGGRMYYGLGALNGLQRSLYSLGTIMLVVGCLVGSVGTIGLTALRIFDRELRSISVPAAYFNLAFIGAIFVSGLALAVSGEPAGKLIKLSHALLTLRPLPPLGPALIVHAVIVALFALYLPFTHMTHFFLKFFTFHRVRWDDRPLVPGSHLERRLARQQEYTATWSAKHIGANGRKSWAKIATENLPSDETGQD